MEQDVNTEPGEKHIDLTPQTSSGRVPLSRQFKKRKSGGPRLRQTQRHVDIRVGILENSHTDVLSNTGKYYKSFYLDKCYSQKESSVMSICNVFHFTSVPKRCPIQKLKCPTGLQECDFIELLKSSFPQLSRVDKCFDILLLDERQRLQPVKLKELSPEGIDHNLSSVGWENSTLYIRLKVCYRQHLTRWSLSKLLILFKTTTISPYRIYKPAGRMTTTAMMHLCPTPVSRKMLKPDLRQGGPKKLFIFM